VAALRLLVSSRDRAGVAPGAGTLGHRLGAVMVWARVDVPLALLAAGHAHALDLMDHPLSPYGRADAIWAVWLPHGEPPLTAVAGGPVYRLSGVIARPVGGGVVTHAVVPAAGPEGRMLFAVDLSHPRVVAVRTVSAVPDCPLEFPGVYRFEGVPATPLTRAVPRRDAMRRALALAGSALVVGAAAGLLDATPGAQADPWRAAVGNLGGELLALAERVDAAAGPHEDLDAKVADLAARTRAGAARMLADVDERPPEPAVARRAGQLDLAVRLASRTHY
jgi:hypothetical protein